MTTAFTRTLSSFLCFLLLSLYAFHASAAPTKGAFESGVYRNLFVEYGLASEKETNDRVKETYQQLFYSDELDDSGEGLFFPVGADMGFIKDIGSNDIRSEGMSYGMMIAVQMSDKPMFDKLWRFAERYMQHKSGWFKGYFAWHLSPRDPFKSIDNNPAPDGELYFAMALYFAHNKWGSGEGVLNYKKQADEIVNNMVNKPESDLSVPMFSKEKLQILFVTEKATGIFTDPSYHLPAFYELFSRWSATDKEMWARAADVSRSFFHKAAHPTTGLFAEYSDFEGKPQKTSFNKNSHNSAYDAFRVMGNIAMDYAWFARDAGQKDLVERQLQFYAQELAAIGRNSAEHSHDGRSLSNWGSSGQTAMIATAAMVTDHENAKLYVKRLWNQATPAGKWRYYDGLLHLFAVLHLSGQYRIIQP